jgi:anti-sigma regulatory factor (Ser/Thr protein kinase)
VSASAGDLAHTHLVAVYEGHDELAATVADFLLDAFEQDGAGLVVGTREHRRAIAHALTARGIAIDDLVGAGRYRSLDARETLTTFMRGGHPDPDALAGAIDDLINSVAGRPVHVFGEMVDLLWADGNVAAAIDLESLWNRAAARQRFALLCAYGHATLEAAGDLASVKGMCERHSAVLPLVGATSPRCVDVDSVERLFVIAPTAPHDVRAFVRSVLDDWRVPDRGGEAEIIASELATNAVRHARSPFVVHVTRTPETIRIAVRDASCDRPVRIVRDDCETGGRGVRLVAALASSWGVVDRADGKSVWAELARA